MPYKKTFGMCGNQTKKIAWGQEVSFKCLTTKNTFWLRFFCKNTWKGQEDVEASHLCKNTWKGQEDVEASHLCKNTWKGQEDVEASHLCNNT
jgi:hypothetical protein